LCRGGASCYIQHSPRTPRLGTCKYCYPESGLSQRARPAAPGGCPRVVLTLTMGRSFSRGYFLCSLSPSLLLFVSHPRLFLPLSLSLCLSHSWAITRAATTTRLLALPLSALAPFLPLMPHDYCCLTNVVDGTMTEAVTGPSSHPNVHEESGKLFNKCVCVCARV
jgi:hypothetical protein